LMAWHVSTPPRFTEVGGIALESVNKKGRMKERVTASISRFIEDGKNLGDATKNP
jgi:hypothetical protein